MNAQERPSITRPGEFGLVVAADSRRGIFDLHNEAVIASGLPIDAIFIGDSITDGWALDVYFQGTGGLVLNRGIGGDQTPFVRRRFAADVLQLQPRLVVLLIGINNLWALDTWWDARLHREPAEIVAEVVADTTAMLAAARQQGIAVALCSILPTDVPYNANTSVRNAAVTAINAQLRTLVEGPREVFVDYHAHLVGPDGATLAPGWADDGLHPHSQGYLVMATTLLAHLDETGLSILTRRGFLSPSVPEK